MDERRARIHDDLRDLVTGELHFEPLERGPYAFDAGLYEDDPTGVIVPRTEDDIVNTVRYAAENGLTLHPRGAGTGITGGAVGPGLVLDFSRYFHRIVEIGHDHVVVEPGVVLETLNHQLAPLGRRIGPDPLGGDVATIGGMVALDATGPSSLRFGTLGDHVEGIRAVLATGEIAELGRERWPGFDEEPDGFKGVIVRKLGALVRRNMDLLVRQPRRPPGHPAAFPLARAASGIDINLPRLVAGSSGTLAIFTEITLRTLPLVNAQSAVLLPFARLTDAAEAVGECLTASPTACELFDWRMIHLARESSPSFREWIAEPSEAVVVLLFEGDDPGAVVARGERVGNQILRQGRLAGAPVVVHRRVDCERMLNLRRVVEPLMMRASGSARPTTLADEVAVPTEQLAEMIRRLQAIFREHDVNWTLDGSVGLGRLNPRPFLDPMEQADLDRLEPLAASICDAALELGGSVGVGLTRALARHPALRRQNAELVPVVREIKDTFDPFNLLNPGMIRGDESGNSPSRMRHYPGFVSLAGTDADPARNEGSGEMVAAIVPAAVPTLLPVLRWTEPGLVGTAAACNACGSCRTSDPSSRMCPTFRALRSERATPRAMANLVRQLASGELDPKLWGSDEFKQTADLCVHCNLCTQDCPSGLDISSLMLEAKAAYVEYHGLTPADWWISRVELWSRIASRLPILSNAILSNRWSRWALERLCGLSRLRRLPRAHRSPFTSRAGRLGLTRPRPHEPGPRVAYFVDVYANYYDQELAEAVVGVLRQAGVNVYVPPGQRDSGMPALVAGDIERARELALTNLRVLGNAVRDGYTVVCSEPTAAMMLQQEYLKLTDDLDATLVAENTREIGQYLQGLSERGQLPTVNQPLRVRVGYHQPCHLRALGVGTPGLDLLRRIPELEVEFIDRGCSGMAGTFGLRRDHFLTSLRAGRGLLSRLGDTDIEIGSTECSACRLQMEQGATKRTLHPVKLLSLAYGLSPALRRQLKEPKPRHEIS